MIGSEEEKGKEKKIVVVSESDSEISQLKKLLFKFGLNRNWENIITINPTHTHTHTGFENLDTEMVFSFCNYQCSLENCGRKFKFLKTWIGNTILIFRPLLAIRPILLSDAFLFSIFGEQGNRDVARDLLFRLDNSSLHACSPSWPVHFSDPFYKIAKIQRRIVEGDWESLPRLADDIGWSPCWLSTNFKRYTGKKLACFILKNKLCHMFWKIVSTDYPIKCIADKAGYSNPLYFSKVFKTRFGISPTLIRRKYSALPELSFLPYHQ